MKKLVYAFLIGIIIISSCKKQLDQHPITSLTAEQFWKTPDDAIFGNAAIYDAVQKTFGGSGRFSEWGDARSDNFTFGGTGENQTNISLNGLTAITPAASWESIYTTIGRANLSIKYIPSITLLSESVKNNYLAQAYGIRAYMYFWAIRLWGDVPVRLLPFEADEKEANLARTNADSILNNVIIADLLLANRLIGSFPSSTTTLSTFELNKGGILAILADAYMWKKDYANALSAINQLITSNRYALTPSTPNFTTYKDIFLTGTSKENIWTLHWNFITDGGNGIGNKIGSSNLTSNYYIDSVAFNKFEQNKTDIRRVLNYDTAMARSTSSSDKIIQIVKYYPIVSDKVVVPSTTQNQVRLPLYRWADILLMQAEAINWLNNNRDGAVAIINQIRTRANAGNLVLRNYDSLKTKLDVERAILDERQLELFAEGKRWFDLVRTGRVLGTMDSLLRKRQGSLGLHETGFTDAQKILWPIHRNALNRDPLLEQNPSYSK